MNSPISSINNNINAQIKQIDQIQSSSHLQNKNNQVNNFNNVNNNTILNTSNNLQNNRINNQGQVLGINPQLMIVKGKALGNRILNTIDTGRSAYALPPEVLDDVYKKILGLQSGGHLKFMSQSLLQRLKRRYPLNIIDGNSPYKSVDEDEEELENIKIKRRPNQNIDESGINDVIQQMLKDKNTPVQRYMLLSMAVQQEGLDAELKEALEKIIDKEVQIHGKQISITFNTIDEAVKFANGNIKQLTRFQDTYYQLLQAKAFTDMFAICMQCQDIEEFMQLTNLMYQAGISDKKRKFLPISDPNTIHDLISFMHMRSSFYSLIQSTLRFLHVCHRPYKKDKRGNKHQGEQQGQSKQEQNQDNKDEDKKQRIESIQKTKKQKVRISSKLTLFPHPKNII